MRGEIYLLFACPLMQMDLQRIFLSTLMVWLFISSSSSGEPADIWDYLNASARGWKAAFCNAYFQRRIFKSVFQKHIFRGGFSKVYFKSIFSEAYFQKDIFQKCLSKVWFSKNIRDYLNAIAGGWRACFCKAFSLQLLRSQTYESNEQKNQKQQSHQIWNTMKHSKGRLAATL